MQCARSFRTSLRRLVTKCITTPASELAPRQLSTTSRREGELHAPLDHVTGIQKRELLAHLAGDCDPFRVMLVKRGPGTYCQPNLMPSAFNVRLIGCICDSHVMHIEYMWLHMGEPKRCGCGYWFELCPTAPL